MSAESFTVLAILEARDRASEIFKKVDESLDKFSETADRAAGTARSAGTAIDEALGRTVDASDRLDVADARLEVAQAKAAEAARALADAEKELLDARRAGADSAAGDAAATDRLFAADQRLAGAQREAAATAKALKDAQAEQVTATRAAAAAGDEQAAAQLKVRDASAESGLKLSTVGKIAGVTALGLGVAGALMVKAAGNFQDSTTHLVTDAGESQKNLAMVQAGILNVSTATGQSASAITNAMYHVESAGIHGASGLAVLKVAAQGARVGGADLDTVSKTLVGTLTAYGMRSQNAAAQTKYATSMMNQLIATVGSGDMRMQDLASSLSSVAPLAAAVGIKFSQVGGAVATMTAQGMSAQQATQDLAHTIRALSNPNNVAIAEMNQLGINAQDVSKNLGQRGLTGTIGMLTRAITDHMGKSGQVIMSAFTQSTTAGQDLQAMLKTMPPQFASLAKSYMNGQVSAKQWRTELQAQTPVNQHLMQQFATLYDKSHSFNSLLASGGPAAQTYTAALAKMMGGATGLNTALMLSGKNQAVFEGNTAKIAAAAKKAGSNVDGWSTIQGTFNFKLESAKTAVENTGIAIGTALLPAATSLLQTVVAIVEPVAAWTASHKTLTAVLFGGVAALAATIAVLAGARKAYKAITGAVDDAKKAYSAVAGIAKKVAGQQAASAGEAAVAQGTAAAEGAAAQETAAAEGAAAQEAAAEETSSSWVASAARTVAAWAVAGGRMIGQAAVWVAQNTVKVAVVAGEQIAAAATTAAAWIAANAAMIAGIGLIVVVVAAAVYEIVKHWSDIVDGAKKAWKAVYDFISKVIDDVIGFVKSHWPLILAILTGPIGLAVLFITRHWAQIKQDTARFAGDMVRIAGRLAGDVVRWFEHMFDLLVTTEARGVSNILHWAASLFTSFIDTEKSGLDNIVHWFEGLPGRILHAVGDLGSLLFGAGERVIQGLINGVMSMIGAVGNAIGGVVSKIKNFLPFSPAREGPLSGAGAPENSGRSIGRLLAAGIATSTPQAAAAAGRMAASVLAATAGLSAGGHSIGSTLAAGALSAVPAGGAAGPGIVINIDLRNTRVMSDRDMDQLVSKVGNAVASRIGPQAGLKWRY